MTVCFAVPSAAPIEEAGRCLMAWRDMGYLTAIAHEDADRSVLDVDLRILQASYPGWPLSINKLAKAALAKWPACQVIVTGGDDVYPDPLKRADEIEREFIAHFMGTLGVMQPTGDDWRPKSLNTKAHNPWLGREWCERSYCGNGPMPGYYYHCHADLELQEIAVRHGLFWQRADVVQKHAHWKRDKRPKPARTIRALEKVDHDRSVYEQRKAADFPEHELL